MAEQGGYVYSTIIKKAELIAKFSAGDDEAKIFFAEIDARRSKISKREENSFAFIVLDVASILNLRSEYQIVIGRCREIIDRGEVKSVEFYSSLARAYARKLGDLSAAIDLMRRAQQADETPAVIEELVRYLLIAERTDEADDLLVSAGGILEPETRCDLEIKLCEAKGDFSRALVLTQKKFTNKEKYSDAERVQETGYMLIRAGHVSEASQLLKEFLETVSYGKNFIAHNVNYELCKKLQGKKVDKPRLAEVLNYANSPLVEGAILTLMDQESQALEKLRLALERDCTNKIEVRNWPVFDELRQRGEFAVLGFQEPVAKAM